MSELILTKNMLQKFARCEINLQRLLGVDSLDDLEAEVKIESPYEFGINDIWQSLQKLQAGETSEEDFYNWCFLLENREEEWIYKGFCLQHAFGINKEGRRAWPVLPETEADWCFLIFDELEDFLWTEDELSTEATEHLLSYFPMMLRNKNKNPEDREYPMRISLAYLRANDDRMWGERGPIVTPDEKNQFRRVLEKLVDAGITEAEQIKAYHCYGGSPLYACEWQTSRDLLLRVFQVTREAYIASSLGYIFYYGRCTNGTPEYEKAFAYFSYAAAHGVIEAIYKLADLYSYGNGCLKSEAAAAHLITELYDAQLPLFCQGKSMKFADIALRMGKCYEYGIDVYQDAYSAYRYYLQADYAIRLRMHDYDFYGDAKVYRNVREALERVRPKMKLLQGNKAGVSLAGQLREALTYCDALELTLSQNDKGTLKVKAIPLLKDKEARTKILVTIPEHSYCELQDGLVLRCKKANVKELPEKAIVTGIESSWGSDTCELLQYGKVLFFLPNKRYDLKLAGRIKATGEKLTIAQVVFEHNGRRYDYLCDSLKIKKGDWVHVSGAASGKLVRVVNIYTCHKSELRLPFERYEHVLSVESHEK